MRFIVKCVSPEDSGEQMQLLDLLLEGVFEAETQQDALNQATDAWIDRLKEFRSRGISWELIAEEQAMEES